VDLIQGVPGDFAVTLYLGSDQALLSHFRNAHSATKEIISRIHMKSTSIEVFQQSQHIFEQYGLRNAVTSVTDKVELDLGHSIPRIEKEAFQGERQLGARVRDRISLSRRFINGVDEWYLSSAGLVTIEPQLVSLSNPSLPKISFHYMICFDRQVKVFDECDMLFVEYGLISAV
jgi:hypothetical protein